MYSYALTFDTNPEKHRAGCATYQIVGNSYSDPVISYFCGENPIMQRNLSITQFHTSCAISNKCGGAQIQHYLPHGSS